jgi:histidine triad (HIT) family protein
LAVAFLDIAQATPGQTLVVPRDHAVDIWSLSEDDAAGVMRVVHRVAKLLRARLKLLGLNVAQANGEAAWQEVPHYHVHLVPRYGDDALVLPWSSTSPGVETLAATHSQILKRLLDPQRLLDRVGKALVSPLVHYRRTASPTCP